MRYSGRMIPRMCGAPGCTTLTTRRTNLCGEHEYRGYGRERDRASSRERGYDRRWDQVSRIHRQRHPLCERCLARGTTTPAELVHHIRPLDAGGELLQLGNLESLCRQCHAETHATTSHPGGVRNPARALSGTGSVPPGSV